MTVSHDAQVAGTELLSTLGAAYRPESGVTAGRMFNGRGLRTDGRFFAFVSRTGDLVVKLAEQDARELVSAGDAAPVTMGKGTLREWVSLPQPHDGDLSSWRDAVEAARRFVSSQE